MNKFSLALPLVALGLVFATPQRRAKPKGPTDFVEELNKAKSAFADKAYSKCIKQLDRARAVVNKLWRKAVLASFPAAHSDEWTIQDKDNSKEIAQAKAMGLGAFVGLAGQPIQRSYRGPNGKRLELSLHLNSPMVRTLSMMFKNPAFMGKNAEKIEYEGFDAILEKRGTQSTMKFIFHGSHYLEAKAWKFEDKELFDFLGQEKMEKVREATK